MLVLANVGNEQMRQKSHVENKRRTTEERLTRGCYAYKCITLRWQSLGTRLPYSQRRSELRVEYENSSQSEERATGMLDLGSQQRGLARANLGQGLVVGAKRLLAAVPERGKHPWMSLRPEADCAVFWKQSTA